METTRTCDTSIALEQEFVVLNRSGLLEMCESDLEHIQSLETHRKCAMLDIIKSIQPPSHESDNSQDFTPAQGFFGISVVVHLETAVGDVQRIRFHFFNNLP